MPAFVAPRFIDGVIVGPLFCAPHQNIALRNAIMSTRVLAKSKTVIFEFRSIYCELLM